MTENQIATIIVACAFQIHVKLGPGLLESVYEAVLCYELTKQGLRVERQVLIPVMWDGAIIGDGFRADLIVENKIIIELKSVEKSNPLHNKQLLTYLRLTNKHLGLLINFGRGRIKDGIERVVNGLIE